MTDRLEIIEEWGTEGTLGEKYLVAIERTKGSLFSSQAPPPHKVSSSSSRAKRKVGKLM